MNKDVKVEVAMLIRRPVSEVFEAFVNPEITTKFWFTKSNGRLEVGKKVVWEWEMYGASTQVDVREIEKDRRILIGWSGYKGPETVEWTFTPFGNNATYVSIANSGFSGEEDDILLQALDSKGGFTWVLGGLKAYLEHNVRLNLVADAHPKGLEEVQRDLK
ncbi:MAG TPA: SRPBCC family protein [Nitrososphaerales archaeon]|nr:SRPBCC family protein [Nitrososphaerales archaeon]